MPSRLADLEVVQKKCQETQKEQEARTGAAARKSRKEESEKIREQWTKRSCSCRLYLTGPKFRYKD